MLNGGHQSRDNPWGPKTGFVGRDSFTGTHQSFPINCLEDPLQAAVWALEPPPPFENLNNKPVQVLEDFFVKTIDTVSLGQTKVPA